MKIGLQISHTAIVTSGVFQRTVITDSNIYNRFAKQLEIGIQRFLRSCSSASVKAQVDYLKGSEVILTLFRVPRVYLTLLMYREVFSVYYRTGNIFYSLRVSGIFLIFLGSQENVSLF